ncbi:MAG: protein-tyrosine-phosphatase [Saprospiraceae bacterium]|nr:protein-tyrosine-phosphatase [Saprospiraceae bacterium]
MNVAINKLLQSVSQSNISEERKAVLAPLIQFIQAQKDQNERIRLNFICTHNSRRSHLSQIWAQTMAYYFGVKDVFCYSGGTEATALFPKVSETLSKQGFDIQTISEGRNPIYAVKFDHNEPPIVCFSKVYNDAFNPQSDFAAILTCNSADENCPVVFGAKQRIPIKYDDPKTFDGTDLMDAKYTERSLEIAREMFYVFSKIVRL